MLAAVYSTVQLILHRFRFIEGDFLHFAVTNMNGRPCALTTFFPWPGKILNPLNEHSSMFILPEVLRADEAEPAQDQLDGAVPPQE